MSSSRASADFDPRAFVLFRRLRRRHYWPSAGPPVKLRRLRRQFLHINDKVFRPNDSTDVVRKEPSSLKKFAAGDAVWSTYKELLGWVVDSLRGTIELSTRKRQRLLHILDTARHKKRISKRNCQKLLGELRSMVLAISGGPGLFSQLQFALQQAEGTRVRLHRSARDHLQDLYLLALDLARRPTYLRELFPADPGHVLGATDAALSGMGGVVFTPDGPRFWRAEFPDDIQRNMVSDTNPDGIYTNSDFELAATVLHEGVIGHTFDITHLTTRTGSDNIPTVAWRNKGSTTTKGSAAYLLRVASLFQRHYAHVPRVHYVPGTANLLADATSRRFDLSSSQLVDLLSSLAPQPLPWRELPVPPELLSIVTSALRQTRHAGMSHPSGPAPRIASGGSAGSHFSTSWGWQTIPYSVASMTKSLSFGSLLTGFGTAVAAAVVTPSQLSTWLTRSCTLPKRSRNWGPRISGSITKAPST